MHTTRSLTSTAPTGRLDRFFVSPVRRTARESADYAGEKVGVRGSGMALSRAKVDSLDWPIVNTVGQH